MNRRADPKDEAVRLHYLRCYARYCRQFSLPFFYWDNGSNRADDNGVTHLHLRKFLTEGLG